MEMDTIKVVLADDHPVARGGIKSLINNSGHIEVIGEASDGEEALSLVRRKKPDVLISDISMSGHNGIELAQIVSHECPQTKVLVLSMHDEPEYILKAYEAGALGYLPKNSNETELIEGVNVINSGQKHLTPTVSQILAQGMISDRSDSSTVKYNLTKREHEILGMLVDGMSNKQIAADLFVSIRTVDTHRTNIMKKLGVKNAADLVRVCLEENLCV